MPTKIERLQLAAHRRKDKDTYEALVLLEEVMTAVQLRGWSKELHNALDDDSWYEDCGCDNCAGYEERTYWSSRTNTYEQRRVKLRDNPVKRLKDDGRKRVRKCVNTWRHNYMGEENRRGH